MPKTLEEILNGDFHWQCCGGDYCKQTEDGEAKDLAEAHAAILSRIREVMPPYKEIKSLGYFVGSSILTKTISEIEQAEGWNAYRAELLRRLEDL